MAANLYVACRPPLSVALFIPHTSDQYQLLTPLLTDLENGDVSLDLIECVPHLLFNGQAKVIILRCAQASPVYVQC